MLSITRSARFTPLNEKYLSLKVNANTFEEVDWEYLFSLKRGSVHCIELYNLGDNVKEIDMKLLETVKNNLGWNKALTVLILKNISLKEEQLVLLCQALSRAHCLQHFSLQKCGLTDNCCRMVCDSLLLAPSVSTLDLSGNHITDEGAKAIANLLKHEELARGMSCWMKSLRGREVDKKKVLGLSRLTLNENSISDEGLSYIVERLFDDIWIKAIDMQNCNVTDRGAKLVIELLGINEDIYVFDLRGNNKISSWILNVVYGILAKNKKNLNQDECLWLSTQKVNAQLRSDEISMEFEHKARMDYEKKSERCLRRTQSCRDQCSQRYDNDDLWKSTSLDQLNKHKKISNISTGTELIY